MYSVVGIGGGLAFLLELERGCRVTVNLAGQVSVQTLVGGRVDELEDGGRLYKTTT